MASPFAMELKNRHDPQPEFEIKLYLMDLAGRVFEVGQLDPQTVKSSAGLTAAMYTHICEISTYVEDVSARVGIDTNATFENHTETGVETLPVYDWGWCIPYSEFEALVQQVLTQLPDETVMWIPSWFGVWVGDPPDVPRKILAKILVVLGVFEAYQAFLEVLEELAPNLLKELAEAIKARDWALVRRLVRKLLDLIVSRRFFQSLATRSERLPHAESSVGSWLGCSRLSDGRCSLPL